MDQTSKAGRLTLAGFVALAGIAARIDAAPPEGEGPWSIGAAPVVSIHPDGSATAPYLSQPLGGSSLGFAFVVQRRVSSGSEIALELSSARAISDLQRGRSIPGPACFVPGCQPTAMSTHRDTILDLLASFRLGDAEVKVGPGLARSVTDQGDYEFLHHDHTNFVLTTGLDFVLPIGRRFSLVPTARYHFVFRGGERWDAGVNRSVVRLGMSVRFRKPLR
jgi:hypothetical protein